MEGFFSIWYLKIVDSVITLVSQKFSASTPITYIRGNAAAAKVFFSHTIWLGSHSFALSDAWEEAYRFTVLAHLL